jgi:hypothetical protein
LLLLHYSNVESVIIVFHGDLILSGCPGIASIDFALVGLGDGGRLGGKQQQRLVLLVNGVVFHLLYYWNLLKPD